MSIFSTHRIVGIATLSRQDHRVAQTREVVCTKMVLPQVIARGLPVDMFFFLFRKIKFF